MIRDSIPLSPWAEVHNMDMSEFIVVINSVAESIKTGAIQGASPQEWVDAQAMSVGEEAGEFLGAYRRYRGFARRAGTRDEMLEELADVVITSMIMFWSLIEDPERVIKKKLKKVVTRGYVNKEDQ